MSSRPITSCRLVQYTGVDLQGAIDVPVTDVEPQIVGLLAEGLKVDWLSDGEKLFLRVWEASGPEPAWAEVFAERPLADVAAILKQAGF